METRSEQSPMMQTASPPSQKAGWWMLFCMPRFFEASAPPVCPRSSCSTHLVRVRVRARARLG